MHVFDLVSPCFPHYVGVLSEHLITRYEVQERHPESKTSPALQNTDLEQKKPRRKDTPALHMSPFAGKKSWCSPFAGAVGTGQGPHHLEVPRAWPLSCPAICVAQSALERSSISSAFQVYSHGSSPRADVEMGRVRELLILQQNWPNAPRQ